MNQQRRDVVAAVIEREGRYLVAQRRDLGSRWEFPGGKVEPGESHHDALKREITEELRIELTTISSEPLATVEWEYEHGTFTLIAYEATSTGTPTPADHRQLRWLLPNEICNLDLLPADWPIAHRLCDSG